MNIILLPGNDPKNKNWLIRMTDVLLSRGESVMPMAYGHWDKQAGHINFDDELSRLEKKLPSEYSIIAKSVGALLTIYGVHKGILSPRRCTFIGIPLTWMRQNNFPIERYLSSYKNIPTTVAQHSLDPTASYEAIKAIFNSFHSIIVKELPGDTHEYDEYEIISEL
jgi:hypothetical protein